jgi:hypothetical protein
MAEVYVAGEEWRVIVKAALGDQRIAESCLKTPGKQVCAEQSGSFPISFNHRKERERFEEGGRFRAQAWIAQQLGQNGGRYKCLVIFESQADSLYIPALTSG